MSQNEVREGEDDSEVGQWLDAPSVCMCKLCGKEKIKAGVNLWNRRFSQKVSC